MQVPRFRCLILISLGIHTILLWLYVSMLPFRPKPFSLPAPEYAEVDLRILPSLTGPHTSGPEKKAPALRPSTTPLRRSGRLKPSTPSAKTDVLPSLGEPSPRETQTPPTPEGTSSGPGVTTPGSGGAAIGGGGPPSGTGETPSATGGAPAGSKGGASASGGAATGTKGSSGSEIDHFS